jgi:hypothetical protein
MSTGVIPRGAKAVATCALVHFEGCAWPATAPRAYDEYVVRAWYAASSGTIMHVAATSPQAGSPAGEYLFMFQDGAIFKQLALPFAAVRTRQRASQQKIARLPAHMSHLFLGTTFGRSRRCYICA